jgi:hypothetical protein
MRPATDRVQPRTLDEAHDVLCRLRPASDAALSVRVDFHRHCAAVYSRTADLDVRHRYEALQCAGMEIRKARDLEHQIDPTVDDESEVDLAEGR